MLSVRQKRKRRPAGEAPHLRRGKPKIFGTGWIIRLAVREPMPQERHFVSPQMCRYCPDATRDRTAGMGAGERQQGRIYGAIWEKFLEVEHE